MNFCCWYRKKQLVLRTASEQIGKYQLHLSGIAYHLSYQIVTTCGWHASSQQRCYH